MEILDFGSGPPVAMIGGVFQPPSALRRLATELGGYQVRVLAHPNWRADAPWAEPPALEAWTRAAAACLPAGPVHLVGQSFGTVIALALARQHRERVRSVVFIEPFFYPAMRGTEDDDAYQQVAAVRDAIFRDTRAGDPEPSLRRWFEMWSGEGAWPRAPQPVRDMLRAAAPLMLDLWDVTDQPTLRLADLAEVSAPSLVLYGERTPAFMRTIARRTAAAIGGARLVELAGAGHFSPLTHAAEVAAELVRFWPTGEPR